MTFTGVLLASAMGLFGLSGCGDSATPAAPDGGQPTETRSLDPTKVDADPTADPTKVEVLPW